MSQTREEIIGKLKFLTTTTGRDHRTGEEFFHGQGSHVVVDVLRDALALLEHESPSDQMRVSQAADAYVAEQGIEHSGGLIERAFQAGATWALPHISDEAIGIIWTAAMTAAINILVKRHNDLNDDDGPLPVLNEQGDCINALKKWMHVDEVYLYEVRHMLGVASAEVVG